MQQSHSVFVFVRRRQGFVLAHRFVIPAHRFLTYGSANSKLTTRRTGVKRRRTGVTVGDACVTLYYT
ncbi:MAG: hypothetical protein SOR67_04205 [Alloprevotella sp.]|nr:hypothetical protein [Alloprevotella sp.]